MQALPSLVSLAPVASTGSGSSFSIGGVGFGRCYVALGHSATRAGLRLKRKAVVPPASPRLSDSPASLRGDRSSRQCIDHISRRVPGQRREFVDLAGKGHELIAPVSSLQVNDLAEILHSG